MDNIKPEVSERTKLLLTIEQQNDAIEVLRNRLESAEVERDMLKENNLQLTHEVNRLKLLVGGE
jgi:predicted nuclease with TOPRIM domain